MDKLVHLALIMDGNGRWAKKRSLPRSEGHKEGAKAAARVALAASRRGISYLTLFCFSTENWKRPKAEIDSIMGLFSDEFGSMLERIRQEDIRIVHLGRRDRLPQTIIARLDKAVDETRDNHGMTLQLALDYGGEDEIERCIRRAMADGVKDISFSTLLSYVDNPDIPAPDYICRSSGEKRLSGFLTLQASYAEIGFYDRLWPDWDESMIDTIIEDFNKRDRRFGGI